MKSQELLFINKWGDQTLYLVVQYYKILEFQRKGLKLKIISIKLFSKVPYSSKIIFTINRFYLSNIYQIFICFYSYFIQSMKKVIPSEKIQISLSNISTNDVIQAPPRIECRFCKQTQNFQSSPNPFLSPCSCLEPIHSYCLADQMQKNMRGQVISSKPQKRYSCLKCQKDIRFLLQASRQCRSKEELGDFAAKRKCFCFCLLLCIAVMVGLLIFVIVIKASQQNTGWASLTNSLLIGLAIIIIVLFLTSTFLCLTEVIFLEKRKVSLIISNNKDKRKYSNRLQIVDCI